MIDYLREQVEFIKYNNVPNTGMIVGMDKKVYTYIKTINEDKNIIVIVERII